MIWYHGSERRRLDDGSVERYWRCALCKGATILKIREGGGQLNANESFRGQKDDYTGEERSF
jgi:hypothetical protein